MNRRQMWIRIIKEYFRAFLPGRLKQTIKENKGWWILWGLLALLWLYNHFGTGERIVYYAAGVLPVVFIFFSSTMHSFRPPKMFYLCPMEDRERKEYICLRTGWRIFVPLLTGSTGILILLVKKYIDGFWAFILLINLFFLCLILCGCQRDDPGREKEKGGAEVLTSIESLCGAVSMFSSIGMLMLLSDGRIPPTGIFWLKALCLGGILLFQLPLILRMRRIWKEELQRTLTYDGR